MRGMPYSCFGTRRGSKLRAPANLHRRTVMKRLEGKTALVTGAASGIGRASAILFASEGASVVVLDRAPAVEETAAQIRSAGGRVTVFVKDSSEEANIADA